jgi:hypothetical protein
VAQYLSIPLLIGLALGVLVGSAYAKASRAWSDYRTRKAELPVLRALAWLLTRKAAGFVLLAAVVAGYAVYLTATSGH